MDDSLSSESRPAAVLVLPASPTLLVRASQAYKLAIYMDFSPETYVDADFFANLRLLVLCLQMGPVST